MADVYDPITIEPRIISFWNENKIYDKVRAKNKGKKPFYFLQGPPYTSGRLHIGHAWNNSMKDMVLRRDFRKFSEDELQDSLSRISYLLPEARRAGRDTEEALEEFLLQIV